ncbi:MAG: BON domain-containing protein [Acidobacteria bacterium]|nr:BON domain-containing protein [Acidobacteriota bacterium]
MRLLTLLLVCVFLANVTAAFAFQKVSDDEIYDNVRRRLANDPDVKGGAFEVDVKDGVVTIKGVVEKDKFKLKAESLAKKVKGVKGVVNQLVVKPRSA